MATLVNSETRENGEQVVILEFTVLSVKLYVLKNFSLIIYLNMLEKSSIYLSNCYSGTKWGQNISCTNIFWRACFILFQVMKSLVIIDCGLCSQLEVTKEKKATAVFLFFIFLRILIFMSLMILTHESPAGSLPVPPALTARVILIQWQNSEHVIFLLSALQRLPFPPRTKLKIHTPAA